MADDALANDYARAGFSKRLGFGKRPALIIVDFARAYLDAASPLYADVEDVRLAATQLLEVARGTATPIFHSRVEYQPGGADGGVFYRKIAALKCFDRGSELGQFADGMSPLPNEVVITKQFASAFFRTPLDEMLKAQGTDTLVIAGLTTSGCVRATAVDAIQHGYIPIVVRDAVGDRHRAPHEANLFDLESKYADVVMVADVERALRGM